VEKAKAFCTYLKPNIVELNNLLTYNKIFIERTANVGVLRRMSPSTTGAPDPCSAARV